MHPLQIHLEKNITGAICDAQTVKDTNDNMELEYRRSKKLQQPRPQTQKNKKSGTKDLD